MKKVDVLNCKEFLSDLKLNKVDKEIRTAIVTNSMVANRISKDFNEATKEATSRYTKDIESEVGTFMCGVGDVNDALEGATFTVKLRLTNPENEAQYYDVNVVTYTFGGNYVIK